MVWVDDVLDIVWHIEEQRHNAISCSVWLRPMIVK